MHIHTYTGIYRGMLPEVEKHISSLPSFQSFEFFFKVGNPMIKTIDLVSAPGYVILCHENIAQLHRDFEAIRELDKGIIWQIQRTTSHEIESAVNLDSDTRRTSSVSLLGVVLPPGDEQK